MGGNFVLSNSAILSKQLNLVASNIAELRARASTSNIDSGSSFSMISGGMSFFKSAIGCRISAPFDGAKSVLSFDLTTVISFGVCFRALRLRKLRKNPSVDRLGSSRFSTFAATLDRSSVLERASKLRLSFVSIAWLSVCVDVANDKNCDELMLRDFSVIVLMVWWWLAAIDDFSIDLALSETDFVGPINKWNLAIYSK